MKNINQLNQKIQILESQKKKFKSLENLSILEFIKYTYIKSKQLKLSMKLENLVSQGNEINFWYDKATKSWIENPKINCRKYSRLEKRASYKKNLKLYKLGFIEKKPFPPLSQDIITKIAQTLNNFSPILDDFKYVFSKIRFPKFVLLNKIHNKFTTFKSEILPHKINNLAINTASIGIKGYRMFQSDCRFIRNTISSTNSIKYLRNIINQANMKISNGHESADFRQSLRVNVGSPSANVIITNQHDFKNKSINSNSSKNIQYKIFEHSI